MLLTLIVPEDADPDNDQDAASISRPLTLTDGKRDA
jgi:hypothetical protein